MHVAIFGASGFLGSRLQYHLLETTDWRIQAVSRQPRKRAPLTTSKAKRLEFVTGDVSDYASTLTLLKNVDVAYYFVHFMGHAGINFYDAELAAADAFSRAARDAGLQRIIYMGGLGDDKDGQSLHLASRHRTGDVLRQNAKQVIEFRASMIIGVGSVGFDIITNVAKRMPIMLLPKAALTLTQPIALDDALRYLQAAATLTIDGHQTIEIGGPEVLSYEAIYRAYADWRGYRRLVLKIPFLPPWVGGKFLDFLTPTIHARIGRVMVDSMTSEMIVHDHAARHLFPDIHPVLIDGAFANLDA